MASDIYTEMGNLLQDDGREDEASDCYESALEYNPNNVLALNNYAYLLAEAGVNLERAEQMSWRAIGAEPDNATYLDTYAWVLYKLQRYDEALEYIERALAIETVPSDVLYEHAGDICYGLRDTVQALDYWRKALALQREGGMVDKDLEMKIKGVR